MSSLAISSVSDLDYKALRVVPRNSAQETMNSLITYMSFFCFFLPVREFTDSKSTITITLASFPSFRVQTCHQNVTRLLLKIQKSATFEDNAVTELPHATLDIKRNPETGVNH